MTGDGSVTERLENWAVVLRQRYCPAAAESLEGRHVPKHPEQWSEPPMTAVKSLIDSEDAAVVERAVCSIDALHHVFLKGHYIGRWTPWKVLRLAYEAGLVKLPRHRGYDVEATYASLLRMGIALVGGALARPAVMRKTRALDLVEGLLAKASDEEVETADEAS